MYPTCSPPSIQERLEIDPSAGRDGGSMREAGRAGIISAPAAGLRVALLPAMCISRGEGAAAKRRKLTSESHIAMSRGREIRLVEAHGG